jgi:hypothetical protein
MKIWWSENSGNKKAGQTDGLVLVTTGSFWEKASTHFFHTAHLKHHSVSPVPLSSCKTVPCWTVAAKTKTWDVTAMTKLSVPRRRWPSCSWPRWTATTTMPTPWGQPLDNPLNTTPQQWQPSRSWCIGQPRRRQWSLKDNPSRRPPWRSSLQQTTTTKTMTLSSPPRSVCSKPSLSLCNHGRIQCIAVGAQCSGNTVGVGLKPKSELWEPVVTTTYKLIW